MAENNPGDILTCDRRPFVGCERYSPGCAHSWFVEGIYPWQQRLGSIPHGQRPEDPFSYDQWMTSEALAGKNGIIGICQHGDLLWKKVSDAQIHAALAIVDAVVPKKVAQRIKAGRPAPKYML